jgi:epoxyqueuosine reductase
MVDYKRRGLKVKTLDKPNYTVDKSLIKRYDQKNLIFNRVSMDPHWSGYQRTTEKVGRESIRQEKPGYTRVDYALSEASWTVHDAYTEAFSWERQKKKMGPSLMGTEWYKEKYEVKDTDEMTSQLKKAAKLAGASMVGVAELNIDWVFANERFSLKPLELPDVKYAVVVAIEMDELGIATSPHSPSAASVGIGYSKMAFIVGTLAEFIRNLGYTAVPSGNDTAFSIPLAVDAGLGELGRNGLLITPEYGPRVRLCKVLTDLPLTPDKPINFGVHEFCKTCKKCVNACAVDAISDEDEPNFMPVCSSTSVGVRKWAVNGEKCYNFWCDNGNDCANCISVCPYNTGRTEASPEEFWHS